MSTPDPIPALKQQLGSELSVLLDGWNAGDVAVLLRTDRPRISELRRGKLERFSLETLIRYLARLRRRVELRLVDVPIGNRVEKLRERDRSRRPDLARATKLRRPQGLTTGNSTKLDAAGP